MEVRDPSVALMVKLNVPVWVGFPVMTAPDVDWAGRLRPGGRLPAVSATVTVGPTAPTLLTAMVAE